MTPKKCEMCGAPLHGYKCEYCGTEYERKICAGRPEACFSCPASECRYTGRQTDEELAYLFSGISLAEGKKKAKSKKRRIQTDEINI